MSPAVAGKWGTENAGQSTCHNQKVGYASPKPAISGWMDTIKVRIKNDFIYISFMVGDGGFGGVLVVVVLVSRFSVGFIAGFGGIESGVLLILSTTWRVTQQAFSLLV